MNFRYCSRGFYKYIEIKTSPNMKEFVLIPRVSSNNSFKVTPNGGSRKESTCWRMCAGKLTRNYLAIGGIYAGRMIDDCFVFTRQPVEILEITRDKYKKA